MTARADGQPGLSPTRASASSIGGGGYSGNVKVIGNTVYSNAIGIYEKANVNPPYGDTISDNLIYANTSIGLQIIGNAYTIVDSNTIYQSVGQAVAVSGGARGVHLVDNILDVDEGTIVTVAADSETGFVANHNLYYRGAQGAATLGSYGGTTAATLAPWQTLTGAGRDGQPRGRSAVREHRRGGWRAGRRRHGAGQRAGRQFRAAAGLAGDRRRHVVRRRASRPTCRAAPATTTRRPQHGHRLRPVHRDGCGRQQRARGQHRAVGERLAIRVSYALPFGFTFYGTTYTSVTVSAQGFLQFAGPDTPYYQTPSVAALEADVRIAPFFTSVYATTASVSTTATSATFTWSGRIYRGRRLQRLRHAVQRRHVPLRLRCREHRVTCR